MACQMAMAYDVVKENPIIKEIETNNGIEKKEKFDIMAFLQCLSEQLSTEKQIQITQSTPKFIGTTLFLALVTVGYFYSTKKKYIPGKEYGSAEWESPKVTKRLLSSQIMRKEIKATKKRYRFHRKKRKKAIRDMKDKYSDASDILLTKQIAVSLYHKESMNNNILIAAGSGGGKTTSFTLPNVLQARDNKYSPAFVITDPKGECLEQVGWFLQNIAKYRVSVLNLKDMLHSLRYNPLHYVDIRKNEGETQSQIRKLATAIMEYQADQEAQKGEAIWIEMGIDCLYSLLLAVYYGFPEEEKNLNTAMELFAMLEIEEDERSFDCDLDFFFRAYEKKYHDNEYALSASYNYWQFRKKCRGKTGQSALATIRPKIAPFLNDNVKRIFSGDDMKLDKLGEERSATFIVLPPLDKMYNFIANIMYIQMFDIIEYNATVVHNQKLPVPVRFILEEFFNTGRIPNFENILSYVRSFGASVAIIIQSFEQLKTMYPKSWGVIIDNCSSLLYMGGLKHTDGLEYLSKILGKGTFDKKTSSRTKGAHNSSNTDNNDKFGRELLDAAELSRIHARKCILLLTGQNPFYDFKNYFKTHKNYKYTFSANKEHVWKMQLSEESPHGEDFYEDIPVKKSFKEIETEFDPDKLYRYIRSRVLSYDFDKDIYIDEGEIQEISTYIESEERSNQEKQAFISDMKKLEMIPLTDEKVIEISAIKEQLAYDNIGIDEGEVMELEEVDEVFDEISELLSDLQDDSIFTIQERLDSV